MKPSSESLSVAKADGVRKVRRILYLVQADLFVPFILRLAAYLQERGWEGCFAAFLPRENLWLRKNKADTEPRDVYAVRHWPIREGLFGAAELDDILRFTVRKTGGDPRVWRDRLLRVASVLDHVLEARCIDAVLIWNGDDYIGRALAVLARRRGIATIFAENGYFPNTLQFDRQGVNVNSSITRLGFSEIVRALEESGRDHTAQPAVADEPDRLQPLAWTDFLRCFLARKADWCYYRHFPEHRGGSWFRSQWLGFRRRLIPPDRAPLPAKFIFVPFQVHDDTQILLNCRLFASMEEFFEFCHSAIRRNFGDEYSIVVKEHPEDLGRYSYRRLRSRYPDVLWLKKYSIDQLLQRADYVFVVNSSVGLQALQRGKPTIVFGESFYTRDEIVFRVDDPAQIDEVIARARQGVSADRRKHIEQFIRFLNEKYFVKGGWRNLTPAGIASAGDRIIGLIADSRQSGA